MRKFLLIILLIINWIGFSYSALATSTDSTKKQNLEKAKQYFSLKNSDTIHELSKITTSGDPMPEKKKNWGINVNGFICNDLFWDTRKMVESREGAILLYPTDVNPDINGLDINATPSFNFVALNTRVTLRIQAPDALGAKISGMVEGWFMGVSNSDINGFAMRHAFIKMDWKSTSLLMGQTWHPLFTERCFPQTVAAGAGVPFQLFGRSPQIRVTQNLGTSSKLMLYINSQRDYLSIGKAGASADYLRNSAIPEVGMQFFYDHKKEKEDNLTNEFFIGLGFDYKYLIPRLVTSGNLYTKEGVHSGAIALFGYYTQNVSPELKWGIRAKASVMQACNEFLVLGGYAVQYYDDFPLNDAVNYSYTSLNTFASWIDIYTNIRSFEIGLFGGYTKNLGSMNKVQDYNNPATYMARGYNIDYIYRASMRVKYSANKLLFGFEPEYTAVKYGDRMNEYGKVEQSSDDRLVHGVRFVLSATLFF